jgi:hypothetical protein
MIKSAKAVLQGIDIIDPVFITEMAAAVIQVVCDV